MTKHQPVPFNPEDQVAIYDDIAEDSPVFERAYRIGVGENQRYATVGEWEGTIFDMVHKGGPLYPHYESEKDQGYWLLSGMTVRQEKAEKSTQDWAHKGWGERKDDKMDECHLMMFDFDQGGPLETIIQRLRKHNVAALIYTTHSHGKTFTDDATVNKIANTQHKTGIVHIADAVRSYFLNEKDFDKRIVDSMEITTEPVDHEGRQYYPVMHMPMPKYRVILFLKEPFKFRMLDEGVTATQRVKEWRTFYEKTAGFFGFSTADSSCKNPARLMYAPQFKPGTELGDIFEFESDHGIGFLDGDFYDAEILRGDILGNISDQMPANVNYVSTEKGEITQFVTPGLVEFIKAHRYDFQIATWLRDMCPEAIMRDDGGDKLELKCPRDEYHTHSDRTESSAAFCWQDGSDGEGWGIRCQTLGCQGHYSQDRGFFDGWAYLDHVIQHYGIVKKDAWELEDYCDEPVQRPDVGLEAMINSIAPDDFGSERYKEVVDEIAKTADDITRDTYVVQLKERFKRKDTLVQKHVDNRIKQLKWEARQAREDTGPKEVQVEDGHVYVYRSQGKNVHIKALQDFIIETEAKSSKPTVFIGTDGDIREIVPGTESTPTALAVMETAELRAWLDKRATLIRETEQGEIEDHIPTATMDTVWKDREMRSQLKPIKSVVSLPVFGPNGVLRTDHGYHEDTGTFFSSKTEFLDVPDEPTDEDLDEAAGIFFYEATRDFPFTDDFTGDEQDMHIYTDEPVEDAPGFYQPNLDRGYSSRLNTLAVGLTVIGRDIIGDAPVPAFLIDKPTPGTGASNLIKMLTWALEGKDLKTLHFPSGNEEEMAKAMLPILQSARPMIVYDNLNHRSKLESSLLANLITAGRFEGRILGQTKQLEVEVKSVFLFAGNQVTASGENTRRFIPIRLDAGVMRPAARVPLVQIDVWAPENRTRLVWAMHVLWQNWIKKGMPMYSGPHGENLATFSRWRSIIGGVLQAAGIERGQFLKGYDNYITEELEEYNEDESWGRWLWHFAKGHNFEPFNATEFKDAMFGMSDTPQLDSFDLDVRDRGQGVTAKAVGITLRNMKGKIFKIEGHECKLAMRGGKKYVIVPVDKEVELETLEVPREW